jgi:hypothetical protein
MKLKRVYVCMMLAIAVALVVLVPVAAPAWATAFPSTGSPSSSQLNTPPPPAWAQDAAWFQRLIFVYASGNAPIQQAAVQTGAAAGLPTNQVGQVSSAVRAAWLRLMRADPASLGRPAKPSPAAQKIVLDALHAQLRAIAGAHYDSLLADSDRAYAQISQPSWLSAHGLTSKSSQSTPHAALSARTGQLTAASPVTTPAANYQTVWATNFSLASSETLANGQTIAPNDAYVALPDAFLKYADVSGFSGSIPSIYQPYYLGSGGPAPFYSVDVRSTDGQHTATGIPIGDVGPWNEDDNWWNPVNTSTTLPASCPVSSSKVSPNSLSNAQVDGICPSSENWRRAAYYLLYKHGGLPFFQPAAYSPTGTYSDPSNFPPVMPADCPEAALASKNNNNVACASSMLGYNGNNGAWLRSNTFQSPVLNQAGIDLSPAVAAALGWTYPASGFVQVNVASLPDTPVTQPAQGSKTWYFAEGYTGGSFTEWLTLENPNTSAATVNVTYLLGPDANGAPQPSIVRTYTVAKQSRSTVLVNDPATAVGPNQNVSMVISSDQPIVAERPMYFTYTQLSVPVPGGSDVLGATGLATQFDFGYLDTRALHDTYLTVLNPNAAAMTYTASYFPASGGAPHNVLHTCPGNSRCTVLVNIEGLTAGAYSATVSLSAPGMVERPMYSKNATTGYTGSADVVGVAQPLTDWYFAEGYTAANFHEWYYLSNPSTSGTVTGTVTFYKDTGTPVTQNISLPPGAQQVVDVNALLGNGNNNSAWVHASTPLLAERVMSFDYTGPVGSGAGATSTSNIPGATDVLGAPAPGTLFEFAEGYTGGQFGEWLTLENPNISPVTVTVTYLPANATAPTVKTYTVPASSRYTVFVNAVISGDISMSVAASQPIVAERPMYFNYTFIGANQTGGTDVVGYQP